MPPKYLSNNLSESNLFDIYSFAQLYQNNLANRRITFIYEGNGKLNFFTATFKDENFAHLVGLSSQTKGYTAEDIFHDCVISNLDLKKCCLSQKIKVVRNKLEVARPLMQISVKCDSFGEYDKFTGIKIKSDSMVSSSPLGIMSFVKDTNNKKNYVPNSILKVSFADVTRTSTQSKILWTIEHDIRQFHKSSARLCKKLNNFNKSDREKLGIFLVQNYGELFEQKEDVSEISSFVFGDKKELKRLAQKPEPPNTKISRCTDEANERNATLGTNKNKTINNGKRER